MSDENENSSPVAAGAFGLSHDSWGRLVLIDSSGRRHSGVEPVRAEFTDAGRLVRIGSLEFFPDPPEPPKQPGQPEQPEQPEQPA